MESKRPLFSIPDHITYLNCAAISPLMSSVVTAGHAGVERKANPWDIQVDDYFQDIDQSRGLFAQLINAHKSSIATIPSTSYGMASALNNVSPSHGTEIIVVADEFPSGYLNAKRWVTDNNGKLTIIPRPTSTLHNVRWDELVVEAIGPDTAAVLLSPVHWFDGTFFDMKLIGNRCREVNAFFIVDGAQTVGALPIDVEQLPVDAIICPTYKWLFGPHSFAFAYFNEKFHEGKPIEEAWANRMDSHKFAELTAYNDMYQPGAQRYNVGQSTSFIRAPMINEALKHVIEWTPTQIQAYCKELAMPIYATAKQYDLLPDLEMKEVHHVIGLKPSPSILQPLLQELRRHDVYVSQRGPTIRISPNVYNNDQDIGKLCHSISDILRNS